MERRSSSGEPSKAKIMALESAEKQAAAEQGEPAAQGEGKAEPMPDGWMEWKDDNGSTYFHHAETGETQWTRPEPAKSVETRESAVRSYSSSDISLGSLVPQPSREALIPQSSGSRSALCLPQAVPEDEERHIADEERRAHYRDELRQLQKLARSVGARRAQEQSPVEKAPTKSGKERLAGLRSEMQQVASSAEQSRAWHDIA